MEGLKGVFGLRPSSIPTYPTKKLQSFARHSVTTSPTSTKGMPKRTMFFVSPLEGSSAGFDGEGTLANQQKLEAMSSTRKSCSTKASIVFERLLAEIATSRAELLSTKNTTGELQIKFFHKMNETINARSSASKIMVFFKTPQRRNLILSEANRESLHCGAI